MDLRVLWGLSIYWTLLLVFVFFANHFAPPLDPTISDPSVDLTTANLTQTNSSIIPFVSASSQTNFGDILKFSGFTFLLPPGTGEALVFGFGIWQTLINLLTAGFLISMIWDG